MLLIRRLSNKPDLWTGSPETGLWSVKSKEFKAQKKSSMWKVASHCTHSTVGAIIWLIGYYQATGKLKSKLKGERIAIGDE